MCCLVAWMTEVGCRVHLLASEAFLYPLGRVSLSGNQVVLGQRGCIPLTQLTIACMFFVHVLFPQAITCEISLKLHPFSVNQFECRHIITGKTPPTHCCRGGITHEVLFRGVDTLLCLKSGLALSPSIGRRTVATYYLEAPVHIELYTVASTLVSKKPIL